LRRLIIYSLFISLLVILTASWWLYNQLATPFFAPLEPETIIEIHRGAQSTAIADMLTSAGLLRRSFPFLLYLRWTGESRLLQAGEYHFDSPASPIQIVRRLVEGDIYYVSVTIPEGLTAHETIELIARENLGDYQEMEELLRRTDWIEDIDGEASSLEGYLFPETYRLSRKAPSKEIIKAMVSQFRSRMEALTQEYPPPEGWNIRRIVTLASIVEKEVGTDEERGLVASVLLNRLHRRMALACDPTIIYALKQAGRYDGNIRKADLNMDSPYNTYIHPGLPPGPIANPGAESLKAALAPPASRYLYFVSKNDGSHHFSEDWRSHAAAVDRYQKRLRR